MTTVVWLRRDLRRADNPALHAAAARGPVLPVFILDRADDHGVRAPGGAGRWWLHHSLRALGKDLGGLLLLRGDPARLLPDLAARAGAGAVHWNRLYEPGTIARDQAVKAALAGAGIAARSFNGALLHEPWEVATGGGGPYKVFTPFWKAALKRPVAEPLPAPILDLAPLPEPGEDLDDWGLLPRDPDWAAGWGDLWRPGEAGAAARLDDFLDGGAAGYGAGRDRPDQDHVSRLSAHLHWGEVSPRQVWTRARFLADAAPARRGDMDKFLAEVGWREFAHHLLYHFPDLPAENWRRAFDAYPWREDGIAGDLRAWRRGRTGYPLVDAGMRELWATGYMHNRVRMVAASFLVKHLRIHWRHGESWFWDTLVDADLANNAAGWQWVAGSGADAAPYFRIFNPIAQGCRYDPRGAYVRRWCPELAALPDDAVHAPFAAPPAVLAAAGVALGETYPHPIVGHEAARAAALAGYAAVKAAG
ncbi:MAG: deoxyribodipyrimidine photo-lyase [Hyphomicrobiales bacterium]|nr:deoxyribodipyrimidine photo-lyase [Hyphomicrobiales bacterium]MCP5372225.1 deoxyribodipyrimidine photo-lyase [Hyphomicrobiales bacterium]